MKKLSVNKNIFKILSIIPISFLYLILFYGIFISLIKSFGMYNAIGLNKWSFKYLYLLFSNETARNMIISAILRTFLVSFIEAFLSVSLAIIISAYLIKNKIYKHKVLYIPVVIPHIVVSMMLILLFSQNGFISRLFYHIGIIKNSNEFYPIINDKYNIGIVIAYLYKGVAYTLSVIYLIMKKNNERFYEVAKLMNVNFINFVKDILVPTSFDSIATSFLILFSFSFGAYEIPYMLGNTSRKLLPVIAYEKYLSPNLNDKPIFLSINLVMIIVGIINLIIYKKILDKGSVKN